MSKERKVTVSCATKFHSDYMAFQLNKYNLLERIYTAHPRNRYLNRVELPLKKVSFLPPIFVSTFILNKLGVFFKRIAKCLDYSLPIYFDWIVARKIKKTDILIVWAWTALRTIQKTKKQNGTVILEECGSCNKFQNEILAEEYKNLNLKAKTFTPQKIVSRELEEASLADYILCPSNYVANSFIMNGFPKEKCVIIPYGVNLDLFKPSYKKNISFNIITVGTIGVRKGHIYLFKALELLNRGYRINCTLIGKVEDDFKPIFENYKHLFTHIEQVPHHDIANCYNQASVFVFPSLDEGMAYVQLEAMACGLPVICTPNSGGDSVIDDGVDGFIVPIRDYESLAKKIEFLYRNQELLTQMGNNAHRKALEFTWDAYGKKLTNFIKSLPPK